MFERFTDRARKVMALANQEAQRFNHEYIGTEHILLGMIEEGSGVGANVLKNLNVDLSRVRLEVEKLVKIGPHMVTMGKLPQTPRAKKVIEYANEEARNLNHNYVGTEHLLLGLLREHEGVAAQVLMNLGLKLEEVREEVLNVLGYGIKHETVVPNGSENQVARLQAQLDHAIRMICRLQPQLDEARNQVSRLLSEGDTEQALERHMSAVGSNDLDAILATYAPDALLITPERTYRGHAEIRSAWEKLLADVFTDDADFKMVRQVVAGDIAFIAWSVETKGVRVPLATDTYLVRDGRIIVQTYAAVVERKGETGQGQAGDPVAST